MLPVVSHKLKELKRNHILCSCGWQYDEPDKKAAWIVLQDRLLDKYLVHLAKVKG